MKYHGALTAPINPSGITPVLSAAQVWAGLRRKCEAPERFVPLIAGAEVLERHADGAGLRRRVHFKPDTGIAEAGTAAEEEIVFYGNVKMDFRTVESGSLVSNIISRGPGGPDDLHLTFTFDLNVPGIEDGTPEAAAHAARRDAMSAIAVPHTIEVIRELAVKGEL